MCCYVLTTRCRGRVQAFGFLPSFRLDTLKQQLRRPDFPTSKQEPAPAPERGQDGQLEARTLTGRMYQKYQRSKQEKQQAQEAPPPSPADGR